MPKTVLDDELQQIWTALLQKSIAKGVNDFASDSRPVCQLMEGILNIICDH